MNIIIQLNGQDITASCRIDGTKINYDSTKRITTASLTIMGRTLSRLSRYDYAHYDEDTYAIDIGELYLCVILDGRDGVTKLFAGQIFKLTLEQSDAPEFEIFYQADLNDYAAWLDRSVCWGGYTLPLPASDADIVRGLVGNFCPQIESQTDIAEIVPVIQAYDWANKTARQVLDDMAGLAGAEWYVDFDAVLHYRLAADAPAAPFALSTSADGVASFPVKVSSYAQDFNNPINTCYVRGATDPATGAYVDAFYQDPISVGKYGVLASSVVDDQITTAWDASLQAKSTVLRYAYPVETGNFTIWKDGLAIGQRVSITEDALGVNGLYIIRALALSWLDPYTVQYDAQFGASQPDLETILRVVLQRSLWASTTKAVGTPAAGSVTDASIAPGGLSASSINSVNSNSIVGLIEAGQIGSVSAGAIVGTLSAAQIGSVSAGTIEGVITAGQIGSVNATTIQGVIVSDQLANQIIDDLGKFATTLRPVPMLQAFPTLPSDNYLAGTFFYYVPNGHFYQINPDGLSYVQNDNPAGALTTFYHIGAISANSIVGLIVAAQIQTITAGQITGQIQAGQIGTINASSISGQVNASQISTVNASSIQGTISAANIGTINATQITGTFSYNQIGSIDASTITINQIQDAQVGFISGGKITAGSIDSSKLSTLALTVGGLGNMPGRINVYSASSLVAQIGTLDSGGYGGWFLVFGAGGAGYTDAKVKTDIGGNLTITQANFTISSSPYTITMSPSTFDPSYSSLAVRVDGSGDTCSHVSRGIVIYNSGSVRGAFVRDPSNPNNVQLTLNNSAILLDGVSGNIRGQVFQCGGLVGGTMTFTVTAGMQLQFAGGIFITHT